MPPAGVPWTVDSIYTSSEEEEEEEHIPISHETLPFFPLSQEVSLFIEPHLNATSATQQDSTLIPQRVESPPARKPLSLRLLALHVVASLGQFPVEAAPLQTLTNNMGPLSHENGNAEPFATAIPANHLSASSKVSIGAAPTQQQSRSGDTESHDSSLRHSVSPMIEFSFIHCVYCRTCH